MAPIRYMNTGIGSSLAKADLVYCTQCKGLLKARLSLKESRVWCDNYPHGCQEFGKSVMYFKLEEIKIPTLTVEERLQRIEDRLELIMTRVRGREI